MSKQNLLVLFGGESAEHEVSINSARNVYKALDKGRYNVELCYIDREGRWWHVDRVEPVANPTQQLNPVLGDGRIVDGHGKTITPDVILPVLHGPNGEDGSVQGLAQLLHVPIVGCGIIGSAVCMDKDVAKRLLMQAGIPVVDYVLHRRGEAAPDYDELRKKLGNVLFVKPANLGSSVGVSKVDSAEALAAALAQAHKHDAKVLIERAVSGREIECAVLGNDDPQASVLGEIKPGEDFYSYDAKYDESSKTETVTNANLPTAQADKVRKLAVETYKALECRGMARVDFFVTDDGTAYVNEVNTLPGFTNISMYPKLWEASGLDYSALLDKLVDLAVQ